MAFLRLEKISNTYARATLTTSDGNWTSISVSFAGRERTSFFFITSQAILADTLCAEVVSALHLEPTMLVATCHEYLLPLSLEFSPVLQGTRRSQHALFHLARVLVYFMPPGTLYDITSPRCEWVERAVAQVNEMEKIRLHK